MIVTDLRMPGADGQAVLRAARERDRRTAVILVTAFATIDAAVAAMKHGAFDFVEKPFPLEELDARVAKALGHARLVSEVVTLRAERSSRRGARQDRRPQPGVAPPRSSSRSAWRRCARRCS